MKHKEKTEKTDCIMCEHWQYKWIDRKMHCMFGKWSINITWNQTITKHMHMLQDQTKRCSEFKERKLNRGSKNEGK